MEITGEEYRGRYELNRDSAEKYILNNLRGEYIVADTGENIRLAQTGAKKVTSHSMESEAHLKSIAAIPQMIENAVFIEERQNDKGNGKYDSYRYYVCGLKIGGTDYTAKIVVGVKNGRAYYDHSLTEIEKGNLIEAASGFKPTGDAPEPSSTAFKDTRLREILQVNSSKAVDENGEPLVVYHGSRRGGFDVFDNTKGDGKYDRIQLFGKL